MSISRLRPHLQSFARHGQNAASSILAAIIPLSIDRLILLPIYSAQVSIVEFGATAWWLAWAALAWTACGGPHNIVLARHASLLEPANLQSFTWRLATRAASAGVASGALMIAAALLVAEELQIPGMPILAGLTVLRSAIIPLEANLRFRGNFRTLVRNRLFEAASLAILVVAVWPTDPVRLATILFVSSLVYFIACARAVGISLGNSPPLSKEVRDEIKAARIISSAGAVLPISPRIVLGLLWSPALLAGFFATTSIMNITLRPVGVLSNFALSVLGRSDKNTSVERLRRRIAELGIATSGLMLVLSYAIGRWGVEAFYGDEFRVETICLWALSGSVAMQTFNFVLRPFALRFGEPAKIAKAAQIALGFQLVSLATLTPLLADTGAAISLFVGSTTLCVLYLREINRLGAD